MSGYAIVRFSSPESTVLALPPGNAKPGMTLATPVMDPGGNGRTLLKVGYRLSHATITRLERLGVQEIWVHYPGLAVLEQRVNPRLHAEQHALAHQMFDSLERVQSRVSAGVRYEQYLETMAELVDQMLGNPTACTFLRRSSQEKPSLVDQSSAVAHLSLLMGMRLKDYLAAERAVLSRRNAIKLSSLGLGAMLHDIGVLKLDPAVVRRFEETGDTSDPEWQTHVRLGHDMVSGKVPPSAAVIVRHHHQHFDGTGFPTPKGVSADREQKGRQIHVFARIVAVAETFHRLCHPRANVRESTVRVIGRMVGDELVQRFDPLVLEAFLEIAPPYPPGKMVQLSSGAWAVPVGHDAIDPCRPIVQPVAAPDDLEPAGVEPAGDLLNLREHPELRIVFAEGVDVSDANFGPPDVRYRASLARSA
ncbi:MAG: HD domain-containing protein [Phycisphaerales bacterium]|nr:HD domain-containing protein [Phycisphaerae bacterium]NNF44660.1 HD domain-containing protein [Phycisphaerales bacterium]NNM27510.1 HD domain-containing protein [Phycisphaerales bacterium]